MSLSKHISTYTDVARVLKLSLENNGGLYTLQTPGKAKHFLMRLSYYRTLYREEMSKQTRMPGLAIETPFDDLNFSLHEDDPCTVVVTEKLEGLFTTLNGEKLGLPQEVATLPPVPKEQIEEESFEEIQSLFNSLKAPE